MSDENPQPTSATDAADPLAAWPEDCPLSEVELRAEMRTVAADIRALDQRVRALFERLPEPAEYDDLEVHDRREFPTGVYYELHFALFGLLEEGLWSETAEEALEQTPESLRQRWLEERRAMVEGRTEIYYV